MTVWIGIFVLVYYSFLYQTPTCFDGRKNGDEVEVDAGGGCPRIPLQNITPPQVVWAESFLIAPGQYNAIAYIENNNAQATTQDQNYTFTFYHNDQPIGTSRGVTALPADSVYPVFVGRVEIDDLPVTRVEAELETTREWYVDRHIRQPFRTVDTDLRDVDTKPRLYAAVENLTLADLYNVEVVATIFNDLGKPVTGSQTFLEYLPAQSTSDVVFTWPQSIAKTVRSCTIPTDVVLGIDLSGSMNNDQVNPPQPLTDATHAAAAFITAVSATDQVGVVTFATEARLVQTLTSNHASAARLVRGLVIDPEEETGYTNTTAAITTAATELSSARHNDNARRAFVLLTDGLPTAPGESDVRPAAIEAARTLTDSGADVYVIGLGAAADEAFVNDLASDASRAYIAPTRADLTRIYGEITTSLCEVGPAKIEVIAKPSFHN